MILFAAAASATLAAWGLLSIWKEHAPLAPIRTLRGVRAYCTCGKVSAPLPWRERRRWHVDHRHATETAQ